MSLYNILCSIKYSLKIKFFKYDLNVKNVIFEIICTHIFRNMQWIRQDEDHHPGV